MDNDEQKKPHIPKTPEYLEAAQAEANAAKEKFFNSVSDNVKFNFDKIEQTVRDLENLNIPFAFFANPFGYNFDLKKGKTYWSYHRFHPLNTEPFTKQADKRMGEANFNAIHSMLLFSTYINSGITIALKNKKTGETIYEYGKD